MDKKGALAVGKDKGPEVCAFEKKYSRIGGYTDDW